MPTPSQRLIHAARNRRYDRLRQLIHRHGVALRTAAGRTALHAAAEEGDLEAARILLDAGADVNARMNDGRTPLHQAAANGGYCDLTDQDVDQNKPFRRNSRRNIQRQVIAVISAIVKERHPLIPPDLEPEEILTSENKSEAFFAIFQIFGQRMELFKEIVARGVDLDRVDPDFADWLRGGPRFFSLTQFLLDHGADPNALNKYGQSVLRGTIELGRTDTVKLLLERGAKLISAPDEPPTKLIELALERSRIDVAEILLDHGMEYDAQTAGMWLHGAAGSGQEKVVVWLLGRGVDIDARDRYGNNTPALAAAKAGQFEIVELLAKRGADVRARDNEGNGLLHGAAPGKESLASVSRLQLPVNEANNKGETALHIAAQHANAEGIRLLVKLGASASAQDSSGNTPLHTVFFSDEFRPHFEFPAFLALVAAGADRSVKNREGKTAFDLAVEYEYPEEYQRLLEPDASVPASDFLWLGTPEYEALLPKGMAIFELNGVKWPSAKHYFDAQKTDDPGARERIRQAETVEAISCRFRDLNITSPPDWPQRCDEIMRSALFAKFSQNERVRQQLLATGAATLVSDANCERYWMENPNADFNTIGRMLMSIRSELRSR